MLRTVKKLKENLKKIVKSLEFPMNCFAIIKFCFSNQISGTVTVPLYYSDCSIFLIKHP